MRDSIKYYRIESGCAWCKVSRVMADAAPRKRTSTYNSPLRAKQAADTRRAIIAAATRLFSAQGWAATTLPAIAKEAGVSVDTIYAVFGTKSALLLAVVEVAIVGDDESPAMVERPDFALLGKGRRPERIRAGVRYTMGVYERSVPILRTLREAAASDPVANERFGRYDDDRRELVAAGMTLILRAEPPDQVVDAVWALVSPEVYSYLLDGRGWSLDQVEDWFAAMVKGTIDRS
jgi:AcrR family transcriptional regulator